MQKDIIVSNQRVFYYPKYVPNHQLVKGLFFTEWLFVIIPIVLGVLIPALSGQLLFRIIGIFIGLLVGASMWVIFVRHGEERSNMAHELACIYHYYTSPQKFRKTPRSEIKGDSLYINTQEVEESKIEKEDNKDSSGKGKKQKEKPSKKDQKKKEQNMEDLFPFRFINDGYIEMENGVYILYFKIQANNLDLLSENDIYRAIDASARNLDTNKYPISFFIQDSIFKVKRNLEEIERCKEMVKVPFLKRLLDQNKELIEEEKDDMNKKANYLRVILSPKRMKVIDVEDVQGRVIKNFHDSLDPTIVSKEELKQMLAIYGNRIFCEELPDTEYAPEIVEEKSLLRSKKKTYKESQLPGIYNFKNLIVPINVEFKPSNAQLGRNIVKTYAISSFLGSTQYTNLLSRVCAIKGVTTMIYLSNLNLARFRINASLDVKAKKSQANDNFDEIDADYEKDTLEGTYKRAKAKRQKLYYLTVYFQLTAKTKAEFKDLEDLFLQEIGDQNISIDNLKSQQKEGYLSVSPIGHDLLADYTKQNIASESVANLYPFNEPMLLDPTGLPLGNVVDSKLMMLFDPFAYRGSNYNMLILGMTGLGKTVLMMLLLQICACKHYYIRNIDFEGVYVDFFKKIGGINVDVSGGNEFCINPLQIRIPDEVKTTLVADYISEVVKWMSVYKPSWSHDDLDLFQYCLKKTYERFGITDDIDVAALPPDRFPILSDVVETIKQERDHADSKDSIATKGMYQKLQLGLEASVNGADARLFNRHTNLGDIDINEIESINFDMSLIMTSDTARKLAQQMNVFTFISQFVNAGMRKDRKVMVSADEIDKCLSKEYMAIIEIFNDYERRFRKRGASFLKATQTIDELNTADTELEAKIKPLFSQPAIKFLFNLGDIDYDKPQKMLNLTNTEVKKLKINRNGQCLMKVNQAVYDLDVLMPLWFKQVKPDAKQLKGQVLNA